MTHHNSRPYTIDLQFRGWIEGLTYLSPPNASLPSTPLCHLFTGIPYALPPLGTYRFQKPRALPSCYRYGSRKSPGRFGEGCGVCPQGGKEGSEDCLQLNVWVPVGREPVGGWPVLFYIHGGFLQFGSPNDLDFRAFLSTSPVKCIIVAPAYRLNIFGFLGSWEFSSSPDFSANLGFWDQRMALQWTYENISYFGGNPANITIAGYSAGSHSVFHQLAYDLGLPDNKAVVKRAVMLSNGPGVQPRSLQDAQEQCNEVLNALGISLDLSPAEKLAALRAMDTRSLVDVASKIKLHQFRAVTDDSFVRKGLLNELSNGVFAKRMLQRGVKLIIGECSEEHHAYGTWRPPQLGYTNMLTRLEADYPSDVCRVLMKHYFPDGVLPSKYKSWQAAFGHIYADIQVHALERGMVHALVKHGAGPLIHRYRIEWRASCVDKRMPIEWGVSHTADMPMWFWGNGETLSAEEQKVSAEAFLEPLGRFVKGEGVDWGTQDPMFVRTLKGDGSVKIERDERLEEGLRLWEVLKRVGATGEKGVAKL